MLSEILRNSHKDTHTHRELPDLVPIAVEGAASDAGAIMAEAVDAVHLAMVAGGSKDVEGPRVRLAGRLQREAGLGGVKHTATVSRGAAPVNNQVHLLHLSTHGHTHIYRYTYIP